MAKQQKTPYMESEHKLLKTKQVLFLLLMRFLYLASLITTYLQYVSVAESKKQSPSSPDALMMSVGCTPLSIYLEFYLWRLVMYLFSAKQTSNQQLTTKFPMFLQVMPSPQLTSNPFQTHTQKQRLLQSSLEEEE